MANEKRLSGHARLAVIGLGFCVLGSCIGTTDPLPPTVVSVSVDPSSASVDALGVTQKFNWTAALDDGTSITSDTAQWSSSDAAGVATVSNRGLATAVGNGTGTITATVGGVSGTATFEVSQVVAQVSVTPASGTLTALGDELDLTGTAEDAGGSSVAGATLTWTTADAAVATVSTTGTVTAVADGTTTITATAAGQSGTATVTVAQTADQLAVTTQPAGASSGVALVTQPVLEVQDSQGNLLTGDNSTQVTASVSGGGALGGTTTATAVNGSIVFTDLSITGTASATTLNFTATGLTTATSTSFNLAPGPVSLAQSLITVSPDPVASGSNTTLTLQARDAQDNELVTGGLTVVFSVSANAGESRGTLSDVTDHGDGTYTALFRGTAAGTAATVTATIDGGAVTSTAPTVTTVAGPTAFITLAPTTSTLVSIGETAQLTATVTDAAGNAASVTPGYSSSDAAVATVNTAGLVTAVSDGTATITASSGAVNSNGATIVVAQAAATVDASPDFAVLSTTGNTTLTVTVQDALGVAIPSPTLAVVSGNVGVVTTAGAVITAVAAGVTDVTVASSGISDVATLAVVDASGYAMLVSSATDAKRVSATAGSTFQVDFRMISPAGGTGNLGSASGTLQWDAAQLTYVSSENLEAGFSWLPNETDVATGTLGFGAFSAAGSAGSFDLARVTFTVIGTAGGAATPLTIAVTAAGDPLGANILSLIQLVGAVVQIQ